MTVELSTAHVVTATIRVLVVDDHDMVRKGIADLLGRHEHIEVVGDAGDSETALAVLEEAPADVAIVDYHLPGASGAQLCEAITLHHPGTRVLILTGYIDDAIIGAVTRAGASGCLGKDAEPSDLIEAVRSVAAGDGWDPEVDPKDRMVSRYGPDSWFEALSRRETEVVRLVARGFTSRHIAEELGVTYHSVKGYLSRAMNKLGCRSRPELAALVAQWGLL